MKIGFDNESSYEHFHEWLDLSIEINKLSGEDAVLIWYVGLEVWNMLKDRKQLLERACAKEFDERDTDGFKV